jgi:hypothetical protein
MGKGCGPADCAKAAPPLSAKAHAIKKILAADPLLAKSTPFSATLRAIETLVSRRI